MGWQLGRASDSGDLLAAAEYTAADVEKEILREEAAAGGVCLLQLGAGQQRQ